MGRGSGIFIRRLNDDDPPPCRTFNVTLMVTQPVSRPNIVLFICDDLAWGDLACHGNPHVRTPNLDRIHRQSARLEHHCSGPLCSPARASLLTGRYHLRTRVIDTYCGRSIIDPEERTLAQALADHRYRGNQRPVEALTRTYYRASYPRRSCRPET